MDGKSSHNVNSKTRNLGQAKGEQQRRTGKGRNHFSIVDALLGRCHFRVFDVCIAFCVAMITQAKPNDSANLLFVMRLLATFEPFRAKAKFFKIKVRERVLCKSKLFDGKQCFRSYFFNFALQKRLTEIRLIDKFENKRNS